MVSNGGDPGARRCLGLSVAARAIERSEVILA